MLLRFEPGPPECSLGGGDGEGGGEGGLVGGAAFEGECWPGVSSWVDFLQPRAQQWWAQLYSGAGEGRPRRWPSWLHAWNDMNEPSVFSGAELTLPRDALHVVQGAPAPSPSSVEVGAGAADASTTRP